MQGITLILIKIFICKLSFGQVINNVSADFDKENSQLIIFYDLISSGSKYERYKVRLFYTQDNGKNFSDTLRFVNGDIGDAIKPDKGKKIHWNYFVENADFNGKNVIFRVEAERDWLFESQRLLHLGGPENAFRSLLLPGLGNAKVRAKDRKYWWITAGTYGLIGSGAFFALNSAKIYDKYKDSKTLIEAENNLKKANSQGKTATALLLAGGFVWLTDIALVALKGAQNRKNQKIVKQKLNQALNLYWNFDLLSRNNLITFKLKL